MGSIDVTWPKRDKLSWENHANDPTSGADKSPTVFSNCNDNAVYLVLRFFVVVVCSEKGIPSVVQLWIGCAFGIDIDDKVFRRPEGSKI